MNAQTIVVATGCVAYLGVLAALGVMAIAQGNHDASIALVALASPGAVAAGVSVSTQRAIAAAATETKAVTQP